MILHYCRLSICNLKFEISIVDFIILIKTEIIILKLNENNMVKVLIIKKKK